MIIGTTGAAVGEIAKIWTHPTRKNLAVARPRERGPVLLSRSCSAASVCWSRAIWCRSRRLVLVSLSRAGRSPRRCGTVATGVSGLRELGWVEACVDEVAVLRGLRPGQSLDEIDVGDRRRHVENWTDGT